jgi:fatty-acyl-CoA synthase
MVLKAADECGADLTGWRMTIGGAALTKTLCEQGRQRGMHIIAGYGLSETAPLISVGRVRPEDMGDDAAEIESLTGTVPGPLISARIVDEAMNDLPRDGQTRGELVLRAPWLTPCYIGDEAASRALWRGGWMHTQDIATIDAHGVIRIRDRLKDVIKTGGEWIDSLALEDLLITADGVVEVAVIAASDPQWGERPLAVVVTEPDADVTLALLNARLAEAIEAGRITRYAKLDRFERVEALPRTSVGKIDKKLLRARFGDARPADTPSL